MSRLIDLIVAVVVLILLLPFLVFVALLVRLSSPGPVLVRSWSRSDDGNPICILRFRTTDVNSATTTRFGQFLPAILHRGTSLARQRLVGTNDS